MEERDRPRLILTVSEDSLRMSPTPLDKLLVLWGDGGQLSVFARYEGGPPKYKFCGFAEMVRDAARELPPHAFEAKAVTAGDGRRVPIKVLN